MWLVQAYRFADRERHSYVVGIYPKKAQALKAADLEDGYRGGKYAMEVTEWDVGFGIEGNQLKGYPRLTRALPDRPFLERGGSRE